MQTEMKSEWKKCLYEKRGSFPDNYVDPASFLNEMRKNVTVRIYSYSWMVRHTLNIVQHFSAIVVFIGLFFYLYQSWMSSTELIVLANGTSLLAYFAWILVFYRRRDLLASSPISTFDIPQSNLHAHLHTARHRQTAISGVLIMMTMLGLTPVLKTLTEDISSNTIALLTIVAFVMNLLFFDYRIHVSSSVGSTSSIAVYQSDQSNQSHQLDQSNCGQMETSEQAVSLNAAIFGSVMLASLLPTKAHVYGLMSLSVSWFALLPLMRIELRQRANPLVIDVLLTLFFLIIAVVMLASLSQAALIAYCFCTIIGTFVLPAYYVYLQRYKNEIHGPWDTAEPSVRRRH